MVGRGVPRWTPLALPRVILDSENQAKPSGNARPWESLENSRGFHFFHEAVMTGIATAFMELKGVRPARER